jgi:2-oxoglutarate dehydrogenase E1 component
MLDQAVSDAATGGAKEVVIGMAHRGRINVLAHILGKPYATIFDEFEGKHPESDELDATGDVKYHMGYNGSREIGGQAIALTLVPNPSHLEVVDPVVVGVTRAKQRIPGGGRDESSVVPICIHGDAAFSGEGVVAETLNLSLLRGFRVGGTIHIIVNNQIGFTTDPIDGRSTRYASDLAKGFDIPIFHVNGDNPDSYMNAIRLAMAYRAKFGRDVLLDLVSYRRQGHNETDEPAFTQPMLYQQIRSHKTPREVWGERLISNGVITSADVQNTEREVMSVLEQIQASDRSQQPAPNAAVTGGVPGVVRKKSAAEGTAVSANKLQSLNEQLLTWPETFAANRRISKTLARRRDALGDAGGIDWGHAETLAFASLLTEGIGIRLTGQDVERGTFSHRQVVLHDADSGLTYIPLQHVDGATSVFDIFNSPLSETAVLGFEYGFSVVARNTLTLWEAQYGDFANVAQPIFDQFIAADHAKWGQDSALVVLLPHGYEGQGPEHSSARLERYLQLCAEGNMRVAYPSTPAQYFHILRRQSLLPQRRPLILMQPKSLLRLPEAASKLSDLTTGTFRAVIDDPIASERREKVRRIVFCTGRLYYDLLAQRRDDVALVRVEELYPWPHDNVAQIVDSYPAIEDVVWAQEEPKNMGAWSFVWPRLRVSTGNAITVRYIGRPERASPAEGYSAHHTREQKRIVDEVFTLPEPAPAKRAKAAAR